MRYVLSSSQISQFQKEKTLELFGLYSDEELKALKELLEECPFDRDPQRNNPPILASLHPSRLGQVVSPLFKEKRIRIAFVQKAPYPNLNMSIAELSPLTETFGAIFLDLETGSLNVLMADTPIDFSQLNDNQLIIAFATDQARYRHQEEDVHTHALKKMGYGFGDKVSHDTHPLIHR